MEETRILSEAQAETQIAQDVMRLLPGAELVGPGCHELRTAQALGLFGREAVGDRAILPA
jgi:hypothetical protein